MVEQQVLALFLARSLSRVLVFSNLNKPMVRIYAGPLCLSHSIQINNDDNYTAVQKDLKKEMQELARITNLKKRQL